MISYGCPKCLHVVTGPEMLAGRLVKCPQCALRMEVPPMPGQPAPKRANPSAGITTGTLLVPALAGAALAALVTLPLTFFPGLNPFSQAPQTSQSVTLAPEGAGVALMAAEARVWSLEGRSLQEAQQLLDIVDKRTLGIKDAMKPTEKEDVLRAHLRSERSAGSREEARLFIDRLNSKSRAFLGETATQLKIKPEDLILEWLTYEGALDLSMMNTIWQEQGNFRNEASKVVDSFLEGVFDPPMPDKGVKIQEQTKSRIVVILFGAKVIEEIVNDAPARQEEGHIVLRWKSNYNYLRELKRGGQPKLVMEEKISVEKGKYSVDYLDWFQEYLKTGHRQHWATQMYDASALEIAQAVQNEKAREELGVKPTAPVRPRVSLKEHFAKLCPSVPLVEAPGIGSGSGFLIEHDRKYYVVTNRHVVENSSPSVAVTFFTGQNQAKEERLAIPPTETAVVAIHRNADLALVDVSRRGAQLRKQGVIPVTLAAADHLPPVGEDVFAIGHPGQGAVNLVQGGVLAKTLTQGIVSAVNRDSVFGKAIQTNVAINWGNSGGPLFDYDGRVVGVNTFGLREKKAENRSLALEGLNFALQISQVHELLNDPSTFSLTTSEIDAVLRPKLEMPNSPPPAAPSSEWRVLSSRGFRVPLRRSSSFTISCSRGRTYRISANATKDLRVNLAVWGGRGVLVATALRTGSNAETEFQARWTGTYVVFIQNPSSTRIPEGMITVYEK